MQLPGPSDFIDIHNHGALPAAGIFTVENLMAHEDRMPSYTDGMVFTCGIHPWHLDENKLGEQLSIVKSCVITDEVIAVGEAGFDKLKGPSTDLQRKAFREQVMIATEAGKPVFIHCVRAWDELLMAHKQIRPGYPWLVHGFRGNKELASQLVSKGMYLSFWFDFVMRPEASDLIKNIPSDRIFLETDGSGADIREIYLKVAGDLELSISELQLRIQQNFLEFFGK